MGRKQITHCAFCNKPGHRVSIARLPMPTVSCFDHSVLRFVNADPKVCGLCVAAVGSSRLRSSNLQKRFGHEAGEVGAVGEELGEAEGAAARE